MPKAGNGVGRTHTKIWSTAGAEAILQLRADYLSETVPMDRFWAQREAEAGSSRPYREVA